MGIFDFLKSNESIIKAAVDNDSKIDAAVSIWVANYTKDGYTVSDKVKEMMWLTIDCQLHPKKYHKDYLMESQIKIEAQVKEDNGETSPLSGLNSVDDLVNKVVRQIKEKREKDK